MKFKKGDLISQKYPSGNIYIWRITDVFKDKYSGKLLTRIIVDNSLSLFTNVGGDGCIGDESKSSNKITKKVTKQEIMLEML